MFVNLMKELTIVEKIHNLLQEKSQDAQEKNKLLKTVTQKKLMIAIINLMLSLFVLEQEMLLENLKKKKSVKQDPPLWENYPFHLLST